MSEDLVIGKQGVIELLKSGRHINKVWLQKGLHGRSYEIIMELIKERKVVVQFVPKQKITQLSSGNNQGVIAQVAPVAYVSVANILETARNRQEQPFIILLDELVDPHNVGAILRTADATGVHGVIIPKRRSLGLTETVAKASAGAIEYVSVARVTNLSQTIDILKKENIWIVGTDVVNADSYTKMDGELPICLIIGNEGRGISSVLLKKCDFKFHIPMSGQVNSLNASVAAALMMYEVNRNRNFKK